MTEIPGTSSVKKTYFEEDLDNKIELETVVNINHIKRSKAKASSLSFDNLQFRNWVLFSSMLVVIFVIFLSLYSIKFLLLILSGPGIGVISFYLKETIRKHLRENDSFIKRY